MQTNLYNLVHRLRTQPRAIRQRVLVVSTCAITGLIVLVWATTLGVHTSKSVAVSSGSKPLTLLKESFNNMIHSSGLGLSHLKASVSSSQSGPLIVPKQ